MMGLSVSLNFHSNVINNTQPRLLYEHQDTSSNGAYYGEY